MNDRVMLRASATLTAILCGCGVPAAAAQPSGVCPSPPSDLVFLPYFTDIKTANGTPLIAGKTFAIRWRNEPLLLTAHHLFGPDGGIAEQMAPEAVAARVQSVVLLDPTTGIAVGTAGPAVLNPGAAVHPRDAADDLVMLRFDGKLRDSGKRATVLPLAEIGAQVGDTVCVITNILLGDRQVRSHQATVDKVSPGSLRYRFTADFELTATSGAPVVNLNGQLVGMNTRGGESEGVDFGFANPLESLRTALAVALPLPGRPDPGVVVPSP